MRGLYDKYGLDEGTRTFTGRGFVSMETID